MSTDSNNKLKEEIIELGKAEVPSPFSPDSSHIVAIDQDVTTTISSSPIDPSKEGKKGKKSKKNKKNKDGSDKEEKEPVAKISYFQLYRFASTWDWFCVM